MRGRLLRAQDFWPVNLPKESDGRGCLNATAVDITGSARDDAPHNQTHDNADILQKRRSEDFRQDDRDEGDESEADEFWRSPSTGDYERPYDNQRQTHNLGFGAVISGQSRKNPVSGRLRQSLDPPPQLGIPEAPTREAPIIRMTVPVTIGGNIR